MQAPRILAIPDPSLVVLIGAAGSGKSTLAARLFRATTILSSDAYRALVSANEADQGATKPAFAILHRELERRLAGGRTAVVDATNVTPFARRGLVRRAAARGIPAVAIVLDLHPDVVLARNAGRGGRVVPEAAVRRQLADLSRSLQPGVLQAEGFEVVHLVRSAAELDALEMEWRG